MFPSEYPSIDLVLEAVQASIRDDLWPETSTPWANRQARTAIWALEHVRERLARGRELLLDEHRQLTELTAAVEAARGLSSTLAAVSRVELDGRLAPDKLDEVLESEVGAMRGVAEQLAALLPDLVGEQLDGVRAVLLRYLHDHDRRVESVVVLAHGC